MERGNKGLVGWAMVIVFSIFLVPYGRMVLAKRYIDVNGLMVSFFDTCYDLLVRQPHSDNPPAPQSQPAPTQSGGSLQ